MALVAGTVVSVIAYRGLRVALSLAVRVWQNPPRLLECRIYWRTSSKPMTFLHHLCRTWWPFLMLKKGRWHLHLWGPILRGQRSSVQGRSSSLLACVDCRQQLGEVRAASRVANRAGKKWPTGPRGGLNRLPHRGNRPTKNRSAIYGEGRRIQ